MLAKCKKVLGNTPTTIGQLLGPRETTLAVIRFIATTRAGRRPWEKELEEEAEARNASLGLESKRMEREDRKENKEER